MNKNQFINDAKAAVKEGNANALVSLYWESRLYSACPYVLTFGSILEGPNYDDMDEICIVEIKTKEDWQSVWSSDVSADCWAEAQESIEGDLSRKQQYAESTISTLTVDEAVRWLTDDELLLQDEFGDFGELVLDAAEKAALSVAKPWSLSFPDEPEVGDPYGYEVNGMTFVTGRVGRDWWESSRWILW